MKKVISAVLALCIVLSVSITGYAAPKADVQAKIDSAAACIVNKYKDTGFAAKDARYFDYVARSGADVSAYADAFALSAGDALYAEGTTINQKIEIISALTATGVFPAEFGAEKAELLLSIHPALTSPYDYVQAISLCEYFDLPESAAYYADELCAYYEMGEGPVFWGDIAYMSGDDVATFVVALAPVANDYGAYIEDALTILEGYRSDDGYTSYGSANTDTTALALAAYSLTGNQAKADEAYGMLMNFYDETTGGYTASYDPIYATIDALIGLEAYLTVAPAVENGWYKDGAKWYFYKDGVKQTGWVKDGGKWYFLDNSGAMKTGWVKSAGKWYFLDKSGAMQTGWVKSGGKWYWLNKSGVMTTGWQKVGSAWYYMNTSGVMQTGWLKSGGKWYYLNTNGAMRTANLTYKGKVYKFNSSGVCLNP